MLRCPNVSPHRAIHIPNWVVGQEKAGNPRPHTGPGANIEGQISTKKQYRYYPSVDCCLGPRCHDLQSSNNNAHLQATIGPPVKSRLQNELVQLAVPHIRQSDALHTFHWLQSIALIAVLHCVYGVRAEMKIMVNVQMWVERHESCELTRCNGAGREGHRLFGWQSLSCSS